MTHCEPPPEWRDVDHEAWLRDPDDNEEPCGWDATRKVWWIQGADSAGHPLFMGREGWTYLCPVPPPSRIAALERVAEAGWGALATRYGWACDCGGDCAAANPPMLGCPVQAMNELNAELTALAALDGEGKG